MKKKYSNELDLNKISKWLVQILNNILKIALYTTVLHFATKQRAGFEERFKRIQRLFKLEFFFQTVLYFHNISLRNKMSNSEFYISIFSRIGIYFDRWKTVHVNS